jgi:hypothetical protein
MSAAGALRTSPEYKRATDFDTTFIPSANSRVAALIERGTVSD